MSLFQAAYPGVVLQASDITYVHAANAIAAFEAKAWRATDSPFDRYLNGESGALSPRAVRGAQLFYGRAGCSGCHSGTFQTDHQFHAAAMPQIGPGKGDGTLGYEDFGRERVTGDPSDRYRFRVPSLRNITLTAPYGHAGSYDTLEAMIAHHLDAVTSLENYDYGQARLPSRPDLDALDYEAMDDAAVVAAIAAANSPVS